MAYAPSDTPPAGTDAPPREGMLESLKNNSLRTAGYAYLVGDAALFAAGMARGDYKEATAGLLWAAGGLAAARYGNPETEKMLDILSGRLSEYLRSQHIEIPKSTGTSLLTKERGVIDHIESFLYAHPSEMLNATYALGGAQMIASAFSNHKSANPWTAASGALVTAGALAGLLLKEKRPDPENPPQGMLGKAMAWIQEKPLRASGTLYGLNNIALIMGGLKDRKTHPGNPSAMFKFLTAGSYIFANTMLSLSSKGHADNQKEGQAATARLADAAAEVIAAQPQGVQNALVEQISGFLASQPETQMKAGDISALLHRKLAQVKQAPPPSGSHGDWQQRIQAHPGVSPAPSL